MFISGIFVVIYLPRFILKINSKWKVTLNCLPYKLVWSYLVSTPSLINTVEEIHFLLKRALIMLRIKCCGKVNLRFSFRGLSFKVYKYTLAKLANRIDNLQKLFNTEYNFFNWISLILRLSWKTQNIKWH